MKIRTDFVTNSSSSSFIVMSAKNKVLTEIIDKYKEQLESNLGAYIDDTDKDTRVVNIEEAWGEVPDNKEQIVVAILNLFASAGLYYDEVDGWDSNEEEIIKQLGDNELALEIFKNRKEINFLCIFIFIFHFSPPFLKKSFYS